MNNEDQFKNSLQQLVESKDFPFDEANWDKAQGLLHPEDRPRNRFFLFGVPALIVLLGSFFTYAYFIPTPVNSKNSSASAENRITPVSTTPVIAPTPEIPQHNASQATPLNTTKLPAERTSTSNEPASSFSSPQKTTPALATAQPVVTPATLRTKATANTAVSAVVVPPLQPAVAGSQEPAPKTSEPVAQQPADGNEETPVTQAPDRSGTIFAAEPSLGTSSPVQETQAPGVAETKPEEPATTEPVTEAPKEATAAKPDTALKTGPDLNFQVLQKKVMFSFEAGAGYLTGWKNPGSTDAKGFNPVAGINYFNYLTDKVAMSFGVQYTSVSKLGYASRTSKITRYDLGEENAVTIITPQKVHYLAVPIKFNYFINAKNAIGFGCNVAYLLTVDSKIETYDQHAMPTGNNKTVGTGSNASEGVKDNYKTSSTRGYAEGFKTFDTQLSVFYRRRIYKNLAVNAEFIYGLSDIKNNTFFNSSVFERNKGLKLTLLFDIFKK